MPFDDASARAEIAVPEEVRILDEMAKLLAKPEDWAKRHAIAPNRYGGVSRCLYGALLQVDHADAGSFQGPGWFPGISGLMFARQAAQKVEVLLLSVLMSGWSAARPGTVAAFNDHPLTTHADVLKLIGWAKEKALETV